jgi:hypothetical protein
MRHQIKEWFYFRRGIKKFSSIKRKRVIVFAVLSPKHVLLALNYLVIPVADWRISSLVIEYLNFNVTHLSGQKAFLFQLPATLSTESNSFAHFRLGILKTPILHCLVRKTTSKDFCLTWLV